MPRPTPSRSNPVLMLFAGSALALTLGAAAPDLPDAYVGQQTCLECHDELGAAFARTRHGRLDHGQQRGGARGCEACHGPGAAHAESGDPADIARLSAADGRLSASVCLECHRTGVTAGWDLSSHGGADLSCQACHRIHGDGRAYLLADRQPALCYECHRDQAGQFQLPSRHPLREGKMACTSCHQPHAAELAGLKPGEPSRHLCLSCHARHQGPFIFEHSPVEEDCGICHAAHGAVANNLLHQNEPFLCLQCHQPHFHSGLMAMTGPFSPPAAVVEDNPAYGQLSGVSTPDGMKRVMMTKCTQCHQAVHGTDLPSQGISGHGRALNR